MFKKYIIIFFLFLTLPLFNAEAASYVKNGSVYIPDNAYLNFTADGYLCNSGYVDRGGFCEKISVPENGIFVEKFNYWVCKSGYEKKGNVCVKIYIPENATLSGSDFICNLGYKRGKLLC